MIKTLYGRLFAVLLVLFLAMATLLFWTSQHASQAFQHEVTQRLHLDLAEHIVADTPIWQQDHLDTAAIKEAFHMMMLLGPAIELYVVSPDGELLTYDAPEQKIKRSRINLDPVKTFLATRKPLPVYGDDPRSITRQKVFSAAPIYDSQNNLKGYLYIILGGEQYDSLVNSIRSNHIVKITVTTIAVGLAIVFVLGVILFYAITRPLNQLSTAMAGFQATDFKQPACTKPIKNADDEVHQLQQTFADMAHRITAQLEHLERTDSLRKELLTQLSHDLKTPVAGQRAYLETLLLQDSQLPPEKREHFLKSALQQCDVLTGRIQDILQLAKLEAGQVAPEHEFFVLTELCSDVLQPIQALAAKRNIQIRFDFDPDLPEVCGDIGMIDRVMVNLLENALRYSEHHATVALELLKREDGVQIRVCDSGQGITAQELPYIFEPFYSTGSGQNQGLGLAICQQIVKLHRSLISVSCPLEGGTCFSFVLPYNH